MYYHAKITQRNDLFTRQNAYDKCVPLGGQFAHGSATPTVRECALMFASRFQKSFADGVYSIPSDMSGISTGISGEYVQKYMLAVGLYVNVLPLAHIVLDYLLFYGIPPPQNVMFMMNVGLSDVAVGLPNVETRIGNWIDESRFAFSVLLDQFINDCVGIESHSKMLEKYGKKPILETHDKHCVQFGMRIDDEDDDLCWAVCLRSLRTLNTTKLFPIHTHEVDVIDQECILHRFNIKPDKSDKSAKLGNRSENEKENLRDNRTVTCIIFKISTRLS